MISPATITASVAAHLLLLGGVVYASTREYERAEVMCLDCGFVWPEEPPPIYVEEKTAPAPPHPRDTQAPARVPVLPRLDAVPVGTDAENEGARPVNAADDRQAGIPGDITGSTAVEQPRQPVGDTGPERAGSVPRLVVEVRPVLERTGLGRLLERNYPTALRDSRVNGRVIIELVVDEDGVPVPGSARVIETSHPAFAEATLRVADRFRFRPARIDGTPVPVVVTIPIMWTAR